MNGLHIASLVSLFSLFLLSLLNSLHCLPFFLFFPFLSSSSPLGFFMLNTIICQLWNTSTVTNKQFPTISSLWYYTCNRKNTQHNYSPVRQRGTEFNDPKIVKIYVPHSWNAHMHICALFSMWYFIFSFFKKNKSVWSQVQTWTHKRQLVYVVNAPYNERVFLSTSTPYWV